MKETGDNEKALARLRASKERALTELRRKGQEAGVEYALHLAAFLDLERLDRWRDESGGSSALLLSRPSFTQIADVMANADGSEEDTVDWARERWGSDVDQAAWVQGFIDGALGKYHELRKKL